MLTLLFDIDGTLINTGGAGGSALREAFSATFGIEEPGEVPFSGRTDRGIIHSLLELHGIECSDEHRQRLCAGYLRALPSHLIEKDGQVLQGVVTLLDTLADRDHVRLGLLTGNLRQAARVKLQHFGLHDRFAFGGYGDDHEDRDDVARAALEAAGYNDRQPAGVWVIGDTPLDIRCARAIGARVLAVATGIHPAAELAEHNPDVLFEDLAREELVLKTLLG